MNTTNMAIPLTNEDKKKIEMSLRANTPFINRSPFGTKSLLTQHRGLVQGGKAFGISFGKAIPEGAISRETQLMQRGIRPKFHERRETQLVPRGINPELDPEGTRPLYPPGESHISVAPSKRPENRPVEGRSQTKIALPEIPVRSRPVVSSQIPSGALVGGTTKPKPIKIQEKSPFNKEEEFEEFSGEMPSPEDIAKGVGKNGKAILNRIWKTALRILNNMSKRKVGGASKGEDLGDAADAVQDVLVKLQDGTIDTSVFSSSTGLLRFMSTVIKNQAIDETRKARRRAVSLSGGKEGEEGGDEGVGGSIQLAGKKIDVGTEEGLKIAKQKIREAMWKLTPRERAVIRAQFFGKEKISTTEMARRLGIPRPAFNSRRGRALAKLKKELSIELLDFITERGKPKYEIPKFQPKEISKSKPVGKKPSPRDTFGDIDPEDVGLKENKALRFKRKHFKISSSPFVRM